MRRRKICSNHDDIMELVSEIEELIDKMNTSNKSIISKIKSRLRKIDKTTMYAKESGQSMENRLSDYRNRIEELGFKRIR